MKKATLLDAVPATSDQTSVWYDLGEQKAYAIVCALSGVDVKGTMSLEACVGSDNPNTDASAVYAAIPNSSQAVDNSTDVVYNVDGAGYRWVRVKWLKDSGTGNLTAKIEVKEPNRM